MEDIKEKTADEIRKIAQEELAKQIRENIDSALIFSYINQLEQENNDLKQKLYTVGYVINKQTGLLEKRDTATDYVS